MNKYLVFESKEQAEKMIPLNEIKKIKLDEHTICLANTSNGFIAFEKNCPHLGDDLSRGKINVYGEVVCPWHSYRFSLNNGAECENRCKSLRLFPTEWANNQIFVLI